MTQSGTFYEERIRFFTEAIARAKLTSSWLAIARFLAFLIFLFCVYGFLTIDGAFLWIGVFALALFIFLVLKNLRVKEKQAFDEKLLFVNANENDIMAGLKNSFTDGAAYLKADSYLNDLDIYGANSIFHLLNRTTTLHGTRRLVHTLNDPMQEIVDILLMQEAVKAMTPMAEARQELTATGLLNNEQKGDLTNLSSWLDTTVDRLNMPWMRVARWALPFFNFASLIFVLATGHVQPLIIGVGISMLLIRQNIKEINLQHLLIGSKHRLLEQYASLLKSFSTIDSGPSVLLSDLKKRAGEAHVAIKELSTLASLFDQRGNLVVLLFVTPLAMFDLQCLIALEDWKKRHRQHLDQWIDCVGDIEYINCLATFAFNNPEYCYPVFERNGLVVNALGLAHPLMSAAERVPNDFSIGKADRLQLITGSNMSGKTTFLRAVGVNVVLAHCGCCVCASSFALAPMRVFSSIRVSDSLHEHTSYFMAELKRLQSIINSLSSGTFSLVLVDEILRGTNSDDKTNGSEQFIRKLLQFNCVALFATHDLGLGELEKKFPGVVGNYCFESVINGDHLHFDFLLKTGIAKNRNASFLMKKMGII